MRGKIIILVTMILSLGVQGANATVLTIDSGHYTWTDTHPYYDEVFLQNDARLDFVGGAMGHLDTWENSLANIDGGTMQYLSTYNNTVVHLYTGNWDWLVSDHDSTVYLYAYDVTYDPTGGIYGDGSLAGYFCRDDTAFEFSLLNRGTYSHVEIVPEPTTFLLFGLGMLLLRKWK